MRKAPVRLQRSTAPASEGADVASNDVNLLSAEPAQEGAGASSGIFLVERAPGRELGHDHTGKRARHARVRSHAKSGHQKARKAVNPLLEHVTLVVYGWKNVEPGTLSWVFPSVGAAVAAARAMRNAVKWAIVAGRREVETEDDEGHDPLDDARAHGAVLIEEAG
jgi:hypothetical protein